MTAIPIFLKRHSPAFGPSPSEGKFFGRTAESSAPIPERHNAFSSIDFPRHFGYYLHAFKEGNPVPEAVPWAK
jgi:hypothetical protein